MDKKYILTALCYALAGLILGAVMAASKDHSQFVTHAHIMLLGFVTTFSYGICYKLWIVSSGTKVSWTQFLFHQSGTLIMVIGLFLIYGKFAEEDTIEPIMGASAGLVILGLVLMIYQFLNKSYSR